MPYVVGLTGGIGSGKSSVASFFEKYDVTVIDADVISRQLSQKNQPAFIHIRQTFGDSYLDENGDLNRAKLREKIFADANAKLQLEQILHPLIRSQISSQIASCNTPYALIVVPLLLENSHYRAMVQRVLVIDCDETTQITRTMKRSHMSAEEVRAIMATQLPRIERLKYADDILENNGGLDSLNQQVVALHHHYLKMAQIHLND